MHSKCPRCGIVDWLLVARGERSYIKCLQCGQIKLIAGRAEIPIPPTGVGAFLLDLFPTADRHQHPPSRP